MSCCDSCIGYSLGPRMRSSWKENPIRNFVDGGRELGASWTDKTFDDVNGLA